MLDKRMLCTVLSVIVVTMTAVVITALPVNQEVLPSQENLPDIEQEEPETDLPEAEEFPYLLQEYEGRIGVYLAGASEPEMVLDVPVRHLPDQDQSLLREGIAVPDYDRLVSLIEDYIS